MARLKVFVVPTGFHDAYVAAPSRKAALHAWGSEHDLFARGVAQEVTDPALMAEPLAHPGEVIKRSRGTTAEQIAALPADVVRPVAEERRKTPAKPPAKAAKPKPKPSRDALEAAERALAEAEETHRHDAAELAERIAALEQERRQVNDTHRRAQTTLSAAVEDARERYDRAIALWRKG